VRSKSAAKKSVKKTTARKASSPKPAKKKTVKKPAAKKPASKKAASKKKAATQKAAAKKGSPKKNAASKKGAPKKKAAAKKAIAKKTTPKNAAKKPPAKKSASKKAAPNQAAAKKPATKKPATKKPATKKPATKKPATKKPATKKPATKKTNAKNITTVKVAPAPPAKKLPKLIIKRKSNGAGPANATTKKRVRKLTPKQLDNFKLTLVIMRDQLAGQVNSLRGDSLQRHDEVNTSEDGTDAFERQFALNLASTEQDGIWEIDEALRRIDQGVFGVCEMTGDPIELERLRAIPFTRHSLAAQAEIEGRRGLNRQSAVRRGLM
ncbi:MAG: RNA polymerase-binding transcription factor DksA, partial [Candidatus Promineifilaceae bacterium]